MPHDAPSREAILDAAERLFARQGFAATTIKQIGTEAKVNSALLYYYFADKETLYRETLRRLLGTLASRSIERVDAASSPAEALRSLIRFQVDFTLARPNAPNLVVRDMIDHDARHAEEQISHMVAGLFRRLCGLIEQGQRDGTFRGDVKPEFAAISSIAQVIYLQIARPAVAVLLGHRATGMTPAMVRAFGEHAADFALAALAARPVAARASAHASARATARRGRATKRKS